MEILLDRKYKLAEYTIGKLYVDGVYICDTLEDKDRGLRQTTPINVIYRIKVPGETAIPTGKYRIDMNTISPKFRYRTWAQPFGGKLPRLLNVPGYSGVLIHVGNTKSSTDGCILTGYNKVKGRVLESTKAFNLLMNNYLLPAVKRGETIWITIK